MKQIIYTRGTNICKGFKKAQIYMPSEPKKYPFLSHNLAEHVCYEVKQKLNIDLERINPE